MPLLALFLRNKTLSHTLPIIPSKTQPIRLNQEMEDPDRLVAIVEHKEALKKYEESENRLKSMRVKVVEFF